MGKAPSTSDCLATESEAPSAVYLLVKERKFPHTLYTAGGFFLAEAKSLLSEADFLGSEKQRKFHLSQKLQRKISAVFTFLRDEKGQTLL
ncbi:hypothetical protein SAMN06272755_3297 [Picosynechococcus sp. OG1]|nr:hypothetical protein SAMN06272755_3263 [Picosynechococcus sp. OG1]SMH59035.1 hypothetical protein SAMN06272755_3297 [Picosynechococcus sp. OG1]SMQ86533.1 hypothetical protein SAMN06272774_3291 [Synechococcus sp. 7002]